MVDFSNSVRLVNEVALKHNIKDSRTYFMYLYSVKFPPRRHTPPLAPAVRQ
jgi:hypothetical protein